MVQLRTTEFNVGNCLPAHLQNQYTNAGKSRTFNLRLNTSKTILLLNETLNIITIGLAKEKHL